MPTPDSKKEVRYVNKDFYSIRESLINFAKVYYPNTYRDFNESSPGMMFMEMTSYVGDVLSYYLDKQFAESLFTYGSEPETVMNFSYVLGYKPKTTSPASVVLDIYQLIPSNGAVDSTNQPDWRYAVNVQRGMVVQSNTNSNVFFRTLDDCDFRQSSSFVSPLSASDSTSTITVYSMTSNVPDYYLLKKQVQASAGVLKSETFSFGEPERFQKILLNDTQITEIDSVTDSDGYTWYEVPYLAQDTILKSVPNTAVYDPTLGVYFQDTPYLLKLLKVPRRFETRIRTDYKTELRFGSGISDSPDEEIIPNLTELSSPLPGGTVNFTQNIDPSNFLFTKTYGQIPHNTTLTVKYYSGGGIESNVPSNDLTKIYEMTLDLNESGLDQTIVNQVRNSVACSNPQPATGGKGTETVDEIKMNAMAQYSSQNRAVTRDDYMARALSMPSRFGSVSKVYIVPDTQLNALTNTTIANPLALNLYTLGYDINGKLTTLNPAVKQNLSVYLDQFRMITDAINIVDAFIVNIGVDFKIVVLPKYNKNEVLIRAIQSVKDFFKTDKWQINQPILLNELVTTIASVDGVQSVIDKPQISCKWSVSSGYSGNRYDILSATENDVVYPPLDPAIFEVKYPNTDIRGQVTTY